MDATARVHRGPRRCGGVAGGGAGDHLDALTAVINWVEAGKAPDAIVATRIEANKIMRSRPLCPYPQAAHFSGNGSSDDDANFACQNASE